DAMGTRNYSFSLVSGALELPTGPMPVAIATGQVFGNPSGHLERLAVDGTTAYWVADTDVRSVSINGGNVLTLASSFSRITTLTIDANSLYFTGARATPTADSGVY